MPHSKASRWTDAHQHQFAVLSDCRASPRHFGAMSTMTIENGQNALEYFTLRSVKCLTA